MATIHMPNEHGECSPGSLLGAVAVFTGSITGEYHWAAILVTAAWAFVAGTPVSISTRAGDLGLNTLVVLIVFAA